MREELFGPNRYFFLTLTEWLTALLIGAASGFCVFTVTSDISPWIGVTAGLAVLTCYHMTRASTVILAVPHIAILIACLQYVFAAWLSFYWPPDNPTYDIAEELPDYLAYAGPVMVALVIGWTIGLLGFRPSNRLRQETKPALLVELDVLLGIGLLAFVAGRFVHIENLGFIFLLLGNLRYVGVFGRMVVRGEGWKWRLAFLLGAEAFLAAGSTMFHDLLLWSAWTFAVWIYAVRPRPRTILAILVVSVLLLPALQKAKWQLRDNPQGEDILAADDLEPAGGSSVTRMTSWLSYMAPAFGDTVTGNLNDQFLADIGIRYNQGWIVNRVMIVVPKYEPYAQGDTLIGAARNLIPRIFDPYKPLADGQYNMARYAGMFIGDKTSMNLGIAGEMYANFGLGGGIVACGTYALLFGLFFRWFAMRAFQQPLWWCLVPYVFYSIIKAEDDTGYALNWTVKACIVLIGVIAFLPNLRHALLSSLRRRTVAPGQPAVGPMPIEPTHSAHLVSR